MTGLELLALARRFWWAPVIAFLAIALLLTRSTNARHRAELAACEQKQAVNLASIETLTAAVEDQNAKVAEWAAAGEKRTEAATKALNQAAQRAKADQSTIDALRASATLRRSENAPCIISDVLAGTRGI